MKSINRLIFMNLALAGWLTGLDVQAQSTAIINQYNSFIINQTILGDIKNMNNIFQSPAGHCL